VDEIISTFNKHQVRYLVIGAQALRLHGMPRFSFDWDIYLPPKDLQNFERVNHLLEEDLDMPLVPLGPRGENFIQTYQTKYGILQFHLLGPAFPPFDEAEKRGVIVKNESGTPVKCVASSDLLKMKEAADRPQDQQDIAFLRLKLSS
jgi:hypothetical protein